MPRKIKADGRTITVPDDATDDEINQIVGAAPAGAATTPPPPTPPGGGFTQPVSDQFSAAHPVLGAASNFGGGSLQGFGETVKQLALHPFDSLYGMVKNVMPSYGPGGMPLPNREAVEGAHQKAQEIVAHPAYEAGRAIGGVLGGEAVGGALGAAAKLPSRVANVVKSASGAGTGTATDLVTDTAKENTAAQAAADKANTKAQAAADAANAKAQTKAAGANATAQDKIAATQAADAAKRAQQLQSHFEQTQAVQEANTKAAAQQSRKVALERGVEQLDPLHKNDLENLQGTVRAEANRRYNELNANLDPEPAPPHLLSELLSDASEAMKGSNTETPIMKDMEKRMLTDDALTYRDLQGYRTEIGTKLATGGLESDVYHAYKNMQAAITDAMSDIAEGRGMGDKFNDARSYYKQMSDTFDDPSSPIYKALKSKEAGGVVKAFKGKDKSGIEALAKYDPELAQRINTTRGYSAEAQKIRNSNAQPKPLPKLAPKPPATASTFTPTVPETVTPDLVSPEITQRGPEDIRAANVKAIGDTANALLTKGNKTTTAIGAMLPHVLGLGGVGADLAGGALAFGAKRAAALALSHPEVVKFLSEPSAAQIAELEKLPPAQRTAAAQNLKPLIDAAQGRGVKVAHALTDLFAVAGALPKGHPVAQSAPPR